MLKDPSVWADINTQSFSQCMSTSTCSFDETTASICGTGGQRAASPRSLSCGRQLAFQPILRVHCEGTHAVCEGVFKFGEDRIVDHIFLGMGEGSAVPSCGS